MLQKVRNTAIVATTTRVLSPPKMSVNSKYKTQLTYRQPQKLAYHDFIKIFRWKL